MSLLVNPRQFRDEPLLNPRAGGPAPLSQQRRFSPRLHSRTYRARRSEHQSRTRQGQSSCPRGASMASSESVAKCAVASRSLDLG